METERPLLYTLDEHRNPVPCDDPLTWAQWFSLNDHVVRQTQLNEETKVSTIFAGIDKAFGTQSPQVFETMVFGGPSDGYTHYSCTWLKAKLVHAETCRLLLKELLEKR